MFLYTLTNRLNGKIYVGATTLSMPRRLGGHRQDAEKGRKTLIAQAIREHGWENFDVTVLATSKSHDQLLAMEAETMKSLNTLAPNGYNRSTYGSHAWTFTAEERAKISRSTKGRKPWNLGIPAGPLSEATKRKISASLKGHQAWNKGMEASIETRLRMRDAHAEITHWNQKAIDCDGTIYQSITAAEE